MRVLIAEDDVFFRRLLLQSLSPEFEVLVAEDGLSAWSMLQQHDAPKLAILDWVMPGMMGPEVCRKTRANPQTAATYLILLTARNSAADITAGMRAGADDYITKPVAPEELRARVRMGRRIMKLQAGLKAQGAALEEALTREKLLQTRMTLSGPKQPARDPSRLALPVTEIFK